MNKPYTFIFFGIVGSGKGTQVELLQKYLKEKDPASHVLWAYPGSEFRKLTAGGSFTGSLVKDRLEKGFLQPDFLTISLFTNILISGLEKDSHLILDGYPRTIEQAQSIEPISGFYGRDTIQIVYIELSKEEAVKRMKLRGRSDDTDEGIAQRFNEYMNNVIPAMNYFKDKEGYTIHTVNGEQSIEQVHHDIVEALSI
jgi:adenylate kinase